MQIFRCCVMLCVFFGADKLNISDNFKTDSWKGQRLVSQIRYQLNSPLLVKGNRQVGELSRTGPTDPSTVLHSPWISRPVSNPLLDPQSHVILTLLEEVLVHCETNKKKIIKIFFRLQVNTRQVKWLLNDVHVLFHQGAHDIQSFHDKLINS